MLLYTFIIVFILFIITRSLLFAILSGVLLIALFVIDILAGVAAHGVVKEIGEIVVAIAVALGVWFGLGTILGTPSPISAIVSCSQLPSFERGDLIILAAVEPDEINAPQIELTAEEFAQANAPFRCGKVGPIEYICGEAEVQFNDGRRERIIVSDKIVVKNFTLEENLGNDVVVYAPQPHGKAPTGDIIHRVFAKFKVAGETYLLMKGDNNQWFDTAVYKIPRAGRPRRDLLGRIGSAFGAIDGNVKGKVIARIPFLGYLKLFLFGEFFEPPGCERIIVREIPFEIK